MFATAFITVKRLKRMHTSMQCGTEFLIKFLYLNLTPYSTKRRQKDATNLQSKDWIQFFFFCLIIIDPSFQTFHNHTTRILEANLVIWVISFWKTNHRIKPQIQTQSHALITWKYTFIKQRTAKLGIGHKALTDTKHSLAVCTSSYISHPDWSSADGRELNCTLKYWVTQI